MKNKFIGIICIIVIALFFVFLLYSKNIRTNNKLVDFANEVQELDIERLTNKDMEIDTSKFDFKSETIVNLSKDEIVIEGSGVNLKKDGNMDTVEIISSGAYRLKGTLNNGRIVVNAKDCDVNLILDNVNITCLTTSPIFIYKAETTMITLEDGSTNILSDENSYNFNDEYSSSVEEEPNSCLYSKSDLIIYGSGSLNIDANNNNAITSKDTLYIENVDITINSKNHGINGKDSNVIKNAKINVICEGDGIRATNDTDTNLGWIRIERSDITIDAGEDAIQAETDLIIYGGKYSIITGEGSNNINIDTNELNIRNRGGKIIESSVDEIEEISRKGIKATRSLLLDDAEINIDSYDDAIHSNENIKVMSGTYILKTGDDGIHADSTVTIDNGNIEILKSYEGIEGNNIVINDGNINITSSDDGINVNGGNDFSGFDNFDKEFSKINMDKIRTSGEFNRMNFKSPGDMKIFEGNRSFMQKEEFKRIPNSGDKNNRNSFTYNIMQNQKIENILIINGGNTTVNANGDGIDSNGGILMTNGSVFVHGPTNSGNGALDYANSFEINGGKLIALGASGMAQSPSSISNQAVIFLNLQSQKENSKIILKDSEGNEIVNCIAQKSFSNIVISTPEVLNGKEYELYINDENVSQVTAGVKNSFGENIVGNINRGKGNKK